MLKAPLDVSQGKVRDGIQSPKFEASSVSKLCPESMANAYHPGAMFFELKINRKLKTDFSHLRVDVFPVETPRPSAAGQHVTSAG
jgi:hypothetical protein